MTALYRCLSTARRGISITCVALLTPLLEKNPTKLGAHALPLVFSMARLIVLAFALGMLHQMWRSGIVAWPEATLAIAIVLALPILGALERVSAERVVDLATSLVDRVGIGAARDAVSVFTGEPSKYDDHRRDEP